MNYVYIHQFTEDHDDTYIILNIKKEREYLLLYGYNDETEEFYEEKFPLKIIINDLNFEERQLYYHLIDRGMTSNEASLMSKLSQLQFSCFLFPHDLHLTIWVCLETYRNFYYKAPFFSNVNDVQYDKNKILIPIETKLLLDMAEPCPPNSIERSSISILSFSNIFNKLIPIISSG